MDDQVYSNISPFRLIAQTSVLGRSHSTSLDTNEIGYKRLPAMAADDIRLKPAILIISETAFRDPTTDKAGDILRDTIASEGGNKWSEPLIEIVPDDATRIELAVRRWTDEEKDQVNLIITTGGTGFATKDITPEVGVASFPFSRSSHAVKYVS
jgi:Probable molybdopterin binding domain